MSAPFYVAQSEKTIITLADSTKNTVTDASTYTDAYSTSGELNAAIFSTADLTLKPRRRELLLCQAHQALCLAKHLVKKDSTKKGPGSVLKSGPGPFLTGCCEWLA
jgi:hypothetical protein